MQTFLPYPDFTRSVAVLDSRRLGKQRVEAFQILRTLRGESRGWANHPAVRMWRGFEPALALYMNGAISEWIRRGYRNTMRFDASASIGELPPWFGDPAFHRSHRSNLLRKDPAHYGAIFYDADPSIPYVWPV